MSSATQVLEPPDDRLAPPAPPDVRQRRAEAMLGIYYHAYAGKPGFELPPELDPLPALVRPLPLDQAASVLGQDDHHDILLRRRRAIATLVEAERNKSDDFESLVKKIYPDIDQSVLNEILAPGITADEVYGLIGPQHCVCSEVTHQVERVPGFPLITKARVSALVNRPVKPICDALDPQNWASCSDFFAGVYPAGQVQGGYPGYGKYDAPKGQSPGQPGTPWQDVVFEHFWMPWSGVTFSWFRNFLNIETHANENAGSNYRIDYSLKRAIGSNALLFQMDGGLDVDDGDIQIVAEGAGTSRVTMTKAVRFTDRTPLSTLPTGTFDVGETLNYLAPFMLRAQLEEVVCDNICCK